MKNKNILIVGVGGQGIILASDIISLAIMKSGYDVKKSEVHGMSQRGGSVFSFIRYGGKVYSPVISEGEADVLISLEEMEVLRWIKYANKNSKIIYSSEKIWPTEVLIGEKSYPEDIEEIIKKIGGNNVYKVNSSEFEEKLGSKRYLNTVIIGVLSKFLDIKRDIWIESIKELVPSNTIDKNLEAFQMGEKI